MHKVSSKINEKIKQKQKTMKQTLRLYFFKKSNYMILNGPWWQYKNAHI